MQPAWVMLCNMDTFIPEKYEDQDTAIVDACLNSSLEVSHHCVFVPSSHWMRIIGECTC